MRNAQAAAPRNTGGEPGLQSVERAITLLQILATTGPARVTGLARELGVHKSTASRLLATLERRGLADRVDDGGAFVLGNGIALLAASAARPRSLSEISRQTLSELAATIGETVSINVLTDDGSVLTVEQVIGSSGLTGFNWLGQRSPAFATAAGKILLAQLPPGDVTRLVPDGTPKLTAHTLDRQSLLKEMPTIRALGFATSRDELELSLGAVAAPVFDSTGIAAAVSASGPTVRIFGERHRDIAACVVTAAAQISTRLGSRPAAEPPG